MPDEVQVPNMPDPKIIKDGKQVDTSAIDDYDSFMAFLMQASIAANTAKLRKYEEDRRSEGEVQTLQLNITPTVEEITIIPSQSLYIENYGPGQIFVSLNSGRHPPTPIPANREAYFPFENHVIERLYVWSALGTVATATALAKY